jgi:hypothetical protein
MLDELERTIALCRRAGGETFADGFAPPLRKALVAAGPPRRHWLEGLRALAGGRVRFAMASAAMGALMAVTGFWMGSRGKAPTASAIYRVPVAKVALVKVDFVAEQPVENVAFEITLPDGLRFVSGSGELAERTLRFEGKLATGSNPLAIPVKGPRPGRYNVIAHAIGPSLDITQEVTLEVRS